jgi:hypothetical protein
MKTENLSDGPRFPRALYQHLICPEPRTNHSGDVGLPLLAGPATTILPSRPTCKRTRRKFGSVRVATSKAPPVGSAEAFASRTAAQRPLLRWELQEWSPGWSHKPVTRSSESHDPPLPLAESRIQYSIASCTISSSPRPPKPAFPFPLHAARARRLLLAIVSGGAAGSPALRLRAPAALSRV